MFPSDPSPVVVVAAEVAADVAGSSDAELLAAAAGFEEQRRRVDVGLARVLGELEARGVCDRDHGLSTAGWLAREAGLPSGVARVRVRVADRVRGKLDRVLVAMVEGRIGWDHARVIVQVANPRIIDQVASVQDELIAAAAGMVFDRWADEVRSLARLIDLDGGHDPSRDGATDALFLSEGIDGLLHVSGTLSGATAQLVKAAVEAAADDAYRRHVRDHEACPELTVPPRSRLRAEGLGEVCRKGQAVDENASRPPRPELTVVVRQDEPGVVRGFDGTRLPPSVTDALVCDPQLWAIVTDRLGVPLDAGRATRLATAAQRAAVAVRDGGCVFPGCGARFAWCDLHHVVAWQHGGVTDVANLAALCRHHHGITHRTGWSMHTTDDQRFFWTTPTGHRIWSQRHHQSHHHQRRRPPDQAGPAPPDEHERAA